MLLRLVVATWNLWGLNAPGVYTRARSTRLVEAPRIAPRRRARGRAVRRDRRAGNGRLGDGTTQARRLASRRRLTLAEDDHETGLAVLSRAAIRTARRLDLASELYGYPSPLAVTTVSAEVEITVFCIHLPLAGSGDREAILAELMERLGDLPSPLLVCGDLNLEPADPFFAILPDAGFLDASRAVAATMPNPGPTVRLDYVLVREEEGADVDVVSARALDDQPDGGGFLPSDHLGVVVELALR
jgi:endonuclease/exonuclease/phosphatase family metal-dependent hydrolase